jgi:asparagine synthase (glutamine-hydrolysing)
MCGIAGIIDPTFSTEARQGWTDKMLQRILHRGPENSSVYSEAQLTLGHNRLKIIDLSDEANQPFVWQDVVIVFNGEIYNYIEIRDTLLQAGYTFRTQGDTEVICAAYKHYGEDCVQHFMGMWAFALWDKTKQKLFCSRDRFGIKPFYYIQQGNNLYFASEYKALKLLPVFQSELNISQVNRGLQMVWSGYKDETFFAQIKSLPPAHNLHWENGKVNTARYWDIDFTQPKSSLSFEEKKNKFHELFKQSVRLHARSDVPNGTCLSGGLDSSAIAGMYATLLPSSAIKSFSIFYEDDVDERPFVREVAAKYSTIEPHYFSPTNQQIEDSFHRVAYHADVPMLGSSFLSQYFLMQLAKSEGVTVVIDGQGADEYLGGYLHSFYRVAGGELAAGRPLNGWSILKHLAEREHFSGKKKRDFLLKSLVSTFANENKIYNLEYAQLSKYLAQPIDNLSFADGATNKLDSFLYHLLLDTTLPTLLHFEDRNSMAFSLESRVPFLDHRLVEFGFTLSREDRITDKAETKYILREALKPVLPKAVYERKDKKGFVTPGEVKWLNGPLRFLLDIDYNQFYWMNKTALQAVVEQYKKGDTSKAAFVWRLAATNYWMKHFAH